MIIGIDPGQNGSVAVINGSEVIALVDTPTTKVKSGKKTKTEYVTKAMVDLLSEYAVSGVKVGIEVSHSMPHQGVASMFRQGYGYGLWIGILSALKLPYELIAPQRWKKAMMDGMGKEKAASCVRAQQMYPHAELFTPRGRALDGRGDALLIATYLQCQTTQ